MLSLADEVDWLKNLARGLLILTEEVVVSEMAEVKTAPLLLCLTNLLEWRHLRILLLAYDMSKTKCCRIMLLLL
jgi:hypothetical protein